MIKPIKFDLKLSNGTKLATLNNLEENLSPALFEHFHSGKLAKWLRVRKLDELTDKMETLQTEYLEYKNELDVQLFKKLCEVFVSEVDLEDAREAMQDYQPAISEQDSNDEVEKLKTENDELRNEIEKHKSEISTLQLKVERHKSRILKLRRDIEEESIKSPFTMSSLSFYGKLNALMKE